MPKRREGTGEPAARSARAAARKALVRNLAVLIPAGSVDAAADAIGVDRSTLYKWKSGAQSPNAIDLAALAGHLGVTVTDVLSDKPAARAATPYDEYPDIKIVADLLAENLSAAMHIRAALQAFAPRREKAAKTDAGVNIGQPGERPKGDPR